MRGIAAVPLVWIAVFLATAGCTVEAAGTPSGQPTKTSTTATEPSVGPAGLKLDGIAPCDLIGLDVQAQFAFSGAPSYLEGGDYLSQCTGITTSREGLGVGLAKTEGIAVVSGAQQTPIQIAGLDAVEITDDATSCVEAIAINEAQSLRVTAYRPSGSTTQEICESARQFAEVMVQNVRSLQGR